MDSRMISSPIPMEMAREISLVTTSSVEEVLGAAMDLLLCRIPPTKERVLALLNLRMAVHVLVEEINGPVAPKKEQCS